MAIAIALLGFNDLGRSVTPIFLFRNRLYIEDITRWREDMNLFSSGKTIFYEPTSFLGPFQGKGPGNEVVYERAQRVSKILFLPRENKIHIFKPPCNVLFIIIDMLMTAF